MEYIDVIKRDPQGRETWRYQGAIVEQNADCVVVEAYFDRPDVEFHGVTLKQGDRFVETYYYDRWYNIFEIYDRDDGSLKGWYCNICQPFIWEQGAISYRDLALDLLVYPDGRQLVLDRDEFETLTLPEEVRQAALDGLTQVQALCRERLGK